MVRLFFEIIEVWGYFCYFFKLFKIIGQRKTNRQLFITKYNVTLSPVANLASRSSFFFIFKDNRFLLITVNTDGMTNEPIGQHLTVACSKIRLPAWLIEVTPDLLQIFCTDGWYRLDIRWIWYELDIRFIILLFIKNIYKYY